METNDGQFFELLKTLPPEEKMNILILEILVTLEEMRENILDILKDIENENNTKKR